MLASSSLFYSHPRPYLKSLVRTHGSVFLMAQSGCSNPVETVSIDRPVFESGIGDGIAVNPGPRGSKLGLARLGLTPHVSSAS